MQKILYLNIEKEFIIGIKEKYKYEFSFPEIKSKKYSILNFLKKR